MEPVSTQPKLSTHSLYTVLNFAVSSNQQQIQLASQQLTAWQKQPNFHALLQRIIGDNSLAFETRWLAAIQLKNGIDRYWRKTAVNAISKEEKQTIRSRCIQIGLKEPDHRLALQNALFVAKIIRTDYPHDWPDAVSSLLEAVRESTQPDAPHIQLSNSLLLLLSVVKELSMAKLPRMRRSLYSVAPDILQLVGSIYVGLFSSWRSFLEQGGSDEGGAIANIERSLLCLRLLRRLIAFGVESPAREQGVHEFWATLTENFQFLLTSLREHGQGLAASIKALLERHVLQIAKLHLGMVENHPSSFPQLPDAIAIAKAYWGILTEFGSTFGAQAIQASNNAIGTDGDAEDDVPFMAKVSLCGLLLLRGCVKMVYNPTPTFKYSTREDKQERQDSKASIKTELLSEELIAEMMGVLVTKFFVFRPVDLRRWQEEPDEWEAQEEGEGDTWRYSVRSCAEKLFLDIILNHKELLIPSLLNVFASVATRENTDVLLKDSIYGAVGLSAAALAGKLDFNSFLINTLIPEIQVQQEGFNILRRRAAIMLGQWVPADADNLDTAAVYQVFQFLLDKSNPQNDLVVRVTAGRQLKNAIDPYSNPSAKLDPYIPVILEQLLALVDEVELAETKMALLNTIQTLIQFMGEGITMHADQIINRLPPIWDAAGDEYMLKQNVLGLVSNLFTAMKASSIKYHPLILPLVASALDVGNENRLYLLDDAVDLWTAVLSQTPESTPDLISLLPHLYPLFETGDDNLKRAFTLTESYVLLAPHIMLSDQAAGVFHAFAVLLDQTLSRDARNSISNVIETFLVAALSVGGQNGVEHIAKIADDTGLAPCLLRGLLDAYTAHQDPSPRGPKTDIDGKVETNYWCVVARFVVGSPGTLLGLLQSWASKGGPEDSMSTLLHLLTELFSHFESLGGPEAEKTVALATCKLFSHNEPQMTRELGNRMQEFITLWTTAIHSLAYDGRDSLIWGEDAAHPPEQFADTSPEDKRRHYLNHSEPVRRIDVRNAVKSAIAEFTQHIGGESAFNEYMDNVDKDVLAQFQELKLFG